MHLSFIQSIWGADLHHMQLLIKFDKEIRFLLRVVDIFNKYAWIVLSKIKNALQLLTLFKKF